MGNGLEEMNVRCDFTFAHVEVDACPFTKLFYYGKQRHQVFNRVGDQCAVISVPLNGEFEAA